MTIQELKTFFENSDYSTETKNAISAFLENATELTQGVLTEIKSILQKELEQDFIDAGVDVVNDPEVKEMQAEYDETVAMIEKDLQEDISFVEKEMEDIESSRKQVADMSDKIDADKIRADLMNQ
jgi:hypothetical protein